MKTSLPRLCENAYDVSRWIGRRLLQFATKIEWTVTGSLPKGPCLYVSNHISHFDPPTLVALLPVRVHVMSMVDLYRYGFEHWLRAVGAFPVHRDQPDAHAARVARRLLEKGQNVLIFPEGGIRNGAASVLEGASLRAGAAALACWTQVPVVPLVCLGTDQLYAWRFWNRSQLIVYQGPMLMPPRVRRGRGARNAFNEKIANALRELDVVARRSPAMSEKLIPRSARERWQEAKMPLDYSRT